MARNIDLTEPMKKQRVRTGICFENTAVDEVPVDVGENIKAQQELNVRHSVCAAATERIKLVARHESRILTRLVNCQYQLKA